MYFLGWLAFFQMSFLPGFLLISILKIRVRSIIEKIIFIFSLSLIINFILVFLLTLTKLYQPVYCYVIFISELIIFLIVVKNQPLTVDIFLPKKSSFLYNLGAIVVEIVIFRFFLLFIQNLSLNSVFLTGDAIDSWNQWAIQWARNQIPKLTYHYPQLIPANWSLTYVFMQTTRVELFAKLLMPLFVLGILLIFLDLYLQTKKTHFLFSLIITGGLFHYYFDSSFLRDGYVDIAFAFFALLPFYAFQLYQKYKQIEYLFLIIIFSLGSILTKQLGALVILTVVPILWQPKRLTLAGNKRPRDYYFWLLIIGLLVIVILGWYLLKLPEIKTAINIFQLYRTAIMGKLTDLSIQSRLAQSIKLLTPNIKGIIIVTITVLLSLLSLVKKTPAQIFFFIILPFFLFWSFFLNYDQRNLAVIFPYLGYTSAAGLEKILVTKYTIRNKKARLSLSIPIIIFIIFIAIASFFVNNNYLLQQQTEGKKQIGIPELNSRLYEYYYKNGFSGKIATSYYRLCNLPEIGKYCLYSQRLSSVKIKQPGVEYLLYPKELLQPVKEERKIIFSFRGWVFSR